MVNSIMVGFSPSLLHPESVHSLYSSLVFFLWDLIFRVLFSRLFHLCFSVPFLYPSLSLISGILRFICPVFLLFYVSLGGHTPPVASHSHASLLSFVALHFLITSASVILKNIDNSPSACLIPVTLLPLYPLDMCSRFKLLFNINSTGFYLWITCVIAFSIR